MKKVLSVFLVLALLAGAFLAGRLTAPIPYTKTTTFYATIESIDYEGEHLVVQGLEINGVNYDWAFQFSIKDVPVEWNHMPLTVEELNAGDLIAVTYTGSILEISPAIIENVLLVRLLKGI